ncbi:diguanylate cyclase [Vibrio aquaticus]|uniref:Diguanylate cyclase n=1 Tax=Vibrio aquaticus TaxID=2496559 RepID=A0A3S0MI98_9VIBR|nr:diguanylate cyclase [Vibrio aquaticus]RTZ15411.1 diguanylate cyclase [Vibrio aquaticus]
MTLVRFAQLPLRYKMILPTWFMVMLIVAVIGVPAIHLLVISQRDAQDTRIQILSQGVATTLQAALMFDDSITAKQQLVNLTFDPVIMAAKVVNSTGDTIAEIHQLPQSCYWHEQQVHCSGITYNTAETDITMAGDQLGKLVVWESLESLERQEQRLFLLLVVLTLFISFLSWGMARILHSVIVKPLTSLHRSMEQMIANGLTKSQLSILNDDEVGKLTVCFNDMMASLVERERDLQRALSRVEQKHRYIHGALDVMKRGVMVASPGNLVNYCNPLAVREVFNDDRSKATREVLEKRFEPKAAVESIMDAIEHHESLSSIELKTQQGDKRYRVSCHPMQETTQSLIQFHDITEHKLAEKRRVLLDLMFEQNQDALLVLDRSLRIETQNSTAQNWFGALATVADLPVKAASLFDPQRQKELLKNGQLVCQVDARHQKKGWTPYELKVRALKSPDGKVEAFVVSLTDQSIGMELKRLSFEASHDPLTGLANRSKALRTLKSRHRKGESQFILFLDLDGFKAVNDQFGHGVGDELLRVVAKRLIGSISKQDMVARIAGDEFLIGVRSSGQCEAIAQRLIETLARPIVINESHCNVTASIGISFWPAIDTTTLDDKIAQADSNMYVAKRLGKNRFYMT